MSNQSVNLACVLKGRSSQAVVQLSRSWKTVQDKLCQLFDYYYVVPLYQ